MRKKLCFLMSAVLALGVCMPGGTMQAIADDDAEAQPVAIQDGTPAESGDADQAGSSDEGALQAAIEGEGSQELSASKSEQVAAPEEDEAPDDEGLQADATRAGPDEAAASEPAAAPLLRAPGASGFHATITSNKDSYSAGSTAIFAVKYTIDQGAFQEGDTITVSIPTEVASKVRFSVDPLHFSSAVDKGDGTWELAFGPNALAALAGSFSMYITTAEVTEQTTAPVTVGGDSKDLTVIPTGSAGGVGVYTDAIMKDANDDKVSYGDYDYSEGMGDDAAQIGVYDSTNDETIGYRLFVNNKRATMDNVTVVDALPDGMSFDRTRDVRVTTPAGEALDPSLYSVSISGQDLTFSYPGTLTDAVWIYYWVNAKGGTGVKYTNRAEISYRSGGTTYQEHRNYVLQGSDYNAACGEKSVDKTVVSADPADQRVTYTIKFWNSNGFGVGEINLTDELDEHVRFVYADEADKFDVSYDEASHSVRISNTSAISGSETEYVRFVIDFSDVPEGYTVENSVGGNTTKTLKMPTVQLDATKTVDGAAPGEGQAFTFQLCGEQGEVLQEKQNAGGAVTFDRLVYSEDDLAADGSDSIMRYTVREKAGGSPSYTYDSTIYDVAVTLHRETGADGRTTVTATPAIAKAGIPVTSMAFDNRLNTTSIAVTKKWVGPAGSEVTVKLLADGQPTDRTLTLGGANGWSDAFTGLPKYNADGGEIAYLVTEAEVAGVDPALYITTVTGSAANGFTITNASTETVGVSGTKTWDDDGDRDGARPPSITVNLLQDGAKIDSKPVEAAADGTWAYSFEGLAKYDPADGHEYAYTVTEDAVDNYATSIDGADITNSHTPATVDIPVTKTWIGSAAGSVTVRLLADGEDTGQTLTLSSGNGWSDLFEGLAKYRDHGVEIAYSISEDAVEGYSAEITGDAASGFTVTNTKSGTPGKPGGNAPGESGHASLLPKAGDEGMLPIALLAIASLVAFSAAALIRRRASAAGGGAIMEGNRLNR